VKGGYFTALYDSQEVARSICSSPYKPSKDQLAAVYTSDKWYPAAHAVIENLSYSAAFPESTRYPVVQRTHSGVILRGRFQLQKNYKAFEIEVSANYEVSFTINPQKASSGWRNILHITNNVGGGDNSHMGNRIPGVWFHSMTTKLYICTGCDGNPDHCLNPPESLPIGKETRVTIRVKGGYFTALYDSQEVARSKCSSPYKPSKDQLAAAYTSDKWYPAAHAVVADLVYSLL